jgi:hypothetical protein
MKNLYSKWFKSLLVFAIVFGISSIKLVAQTADSIVKQEREFKNTIRFNITNPLIFGSKSIIFGYERILKNNQSFSINIGQASFPTLKFGVSDEFRAKTVLSEGGFHISGDYRFYLSKLNRYNAPRGVYIGPYYSYNKFNKGHAWEYTASSGGSPVTVESDLNIKINTVGVELGYQFVFWKRFSVDLILLGPGVAGYKLKADIGGNLSEEDRQKFFDLLNEALKDKFPGYAGSINGGDGEFEKKGYKSTTSLGYRYMINVGYRF